MPHAHPGAAGSRRRAWSRPHENEYTDHGELCFVEYAQTLKNRERLFAKIRAAHARARILNELPPEEGFELYKQAFSQASSAPAAAPPLSALPVLRFTKTAHL